MRTLVDNLWRSVALTPDRDPRRSIVQRYAVAILLTAGVIVLRWYPWRNLHEGFPFATMLCVIAFIAYYGGFGPGLAAVLVSLTVANYLFVGPVFSFAISDTRTVLALLAFSLGGVAISVLGELGRRKLTQTVMEAEIRGVSQDSLIANDERLRIAESALAAGTWDWDIIHQKVYWSDAFRRLYDYPLEEEATLEKSIARIHPEDRDRVVQHIQELLRQRLHNWAMEFRILTAGGRTRWVRSSGHAFYDASGKSRRLAGINIDITAQKAADQELRNNEARMRLLMQYARVGGWEWDVRERKSTWSFELHDVLGLDRSVPPSFESVLLHIHPDDREFIRHTIQQICEGAADQFQYEYRIIGSDHVERYIHERGMVVRDPDAHCIRLIGLSFDITSRRKAETLEPLHT